MAKYVQLSDLIYFDQKATEWNKNHFVYKQDGMSLISDTTVTAIVNHLNNVEDWDTVPGGSGDVDTDTSITTALDDYFANKTLSLGTNSTTTT